MSAKENFRTMAKTVCLMLQVPLAAILASSSLVAQTSEKPTPEAPSSIERAIDLTVKGRCQEALPILKRSLSQLKNKQVEYRAAMATARCAMSLDQDQTSVNELWILKRDFPLVQGGVLFVATTFVLINFATDLLYGYLDPRIRLA